MIPMGRGIAICFLCLMFLQPVSVFAGQLVMKNGDVITGAISKISDGDVYIEPAYADEFAVSLSDVASIENDKVLEVELKDGTEVAGQFAGAAADGRQVLVVEGSPM